MTSNEKKWFIYAGVEQQGPLSFDDVRAAIASGAVRSHHLAWCEGMDNWSKIGDIPAFQAALNPQPAPIATPPPLPIAPAPSPPPVSKPEPRVFKAHSDGAEHEIIREDDSNPSISTQYNPSAPYAPAPPAYAQPIAQPTQPSAAPVAMTAAAALTQVIRPAEEVHPEIGSETEDLSAFIDMKLPPDERTGSLDVRKLRQAEKEAEKAAKAAARSKKKFDEKFADPETRRSRAVVIGGFLILGLALGGGAGMGYRYFQQNPRLFVSLPETPGLRTEDRQELEAAAFARPADGAKLALVLAPPSTAPIFFISSNLPDGSAFDVSLHGEAGTLVGAESAEGSAHIMLDHGLGKTDPIKAKDGAPLPPGRYQVEAFDSANPQLRAAKSMLLTNGRSEAAYQAQLKDWKDRNRPALDLAGAHGLADSMTAQLDTLEKAQASEMGGIQAKWKDLDAEVAHQIERAKKPTPAATASSSSVPAPTAAPSALPVAVLEALEAARTAVGQAFAARTPENIAQARAKLAQLKSVLDSAAPSPSANSAGGPGNAPQS